METSNFLVEKYNIDDILIKQPKKYTEYYVSKVKYKESELVVQFPKMIFSEDPGEKNIELEFINNKGYNKEIYNFLKHVDQFIIKQIQEKSQEWFEKTIPGESVKKMYNSFIKAPKSSEHKCNVNFSLKVSKNEVKSVFLEKRGNEIDFSEFKKNEIVECIAQFKYIFFSKDTCFPVWELVSAKLHKKVLKVPNFGFIDDPDDQVVESDDEEIESFRFF